MKLRNKKTGEIKEVSDLYFINKDKNGNLTEYGEFWSINELNEEWEDYEEPEGWWFIDSAYEVHATNSTLKNLEADREIGNYFETKEEAEKAVEKLKAWKRLKDKGFRFIPEASYVEPMKEICESMIFIACTMNDYREFVFGDNADIKLLFGENNE